MVWNISLKFALLLSLFYEDTHLPQSAYERLISSPLHFNFYKVELQGVVLMCFGGGRRGVLYPKGLL